MHKLLPSLFAALLLLTAGCEHETVDPNAGTVPLTITFKAEYDGEPLAKYVDYNYDDYKVQFSRFNTFLSDVKLLKGSEAITLSEIEWVDFTPDFAPDDNAVEVKVTYNVPAGDYTGLSMGYGVNEALNAKKPNDFAAGHPLANEVEYWSGWKSYIFNKIEGQGDGDGDGQADIFLVYHCGSDKVYREYTFVQNIAANSAASVTVVFDLKNLFYVDGQWFDLRVDENQATSNNPSNVTVARILMDNFDNATQVVVQ
jgi:hypothetical protein